MLRGFGLVQVVGQADQAVMNHGPAQRDAGGTKDRDTAELVAAEPGSGRVVRLTVELAGCRVEPALRAAGYSDVRP